MTSLPAVEAAPARKSSPEARRLIAAGARRRKQRAVFVGTGLAVAAAVLFCISLSVGDFPIPLSDVVPAVFGQGDADSHFIIHTLRLPRALTAVLVGAAFGMSGAIFQTMTRNALASPDIIGISAGATASAVVAIVVFSAGSAFVAGAALVGALLTFAAIYLLAWKRGVSSYRLVLVGIGVSAVCTGVTQYLLTRAEIYEAQRAAVWFTGSLNGRGWEHVRPLVVALAVLVPAALWLCRPLRALQLGDDTARGLGARVEWSRGSLLMVAVAMVAAATASAGPVSFAPFVCGPIARRLTRGTGLNLVPAALTGVVLMLSADLIGRRLFAPTELPVGLITGVIGGSYLIWLLARTNKSGKGG